MNWDELDLQPAADGIRLPIRAAPGARRDEIKGVHNGKLKVATTAAPEKGKANKAICTFLAKRLGIPRRSLEIIHGATAQDKVLLVRDMTASDLKERLRNAVSGS